MMQLSLIRMKPTTTEQRAALKVAGYVHITGLPLMDLHKRPIGYIGEHLRPANLGKSGSNNSKDVLITLGGETWLRRWQQGMPELPWILRFELCPHEGDAWVPCSNGDSIKQEYLDARAADPDWEQLER